MRIWYPIPPLCLDRQRLLGEHRELHCIWIVITQSKTGYAYHPETCRWRAFLPALAARHRQLVNELQRRGYRHASPLPPSPRCGHVHDRDADIVWPKTIESIESMRALLAAKQS